MAGELRLTYEDLRLPGNEWMGLMGLTRTLQAGSGAYAGLAAYGAVTGRRGGFFTGGFELGWRGRWRDLYGELGLFAGGGGGGAAPQGGGLMLRPQIALGWDAGGWRAGVQAARVRFPNGAIDSAQLALSVARSWSWWLRPGWGGERSRLPVLERTHWFGVQSTQYFPRAGTLGRHGRPLAPRLDLIGVRWRPHWRGPWYVDVETAGAWGGGVDGYAQVLAGLARWQGLTGRLRLGGGIMVGAAGGGSVDTGGGLLGRVWAGAAYDVGAWRVDLNGGVTAAREGGFTATSVTAGLSRVLRGVRPSPGDHRRTVGWHRWRVRPSWQRYVGLEPGDRKGSSPYAGVPVDLVGIKLDGATPWPGVFVSGQAWGAFDGGAGGYAVGFLGLGWEAPHGTWRPWVEVDLGAAGGGGMAVGPGILAQPMLGLVRLMSGDGSLSLGVGRVTALAGTLRAWVVEAAWSYRFSTPAAP